MKTLPLDEAYQQATKGPLDAQYGTETCFHSGNKACIVKHVASTDTDEGSCETVAEIWPTCNDSDKYDAALLAHAFNVLPEVVATLQAVHDDFDGMTLMPSGLADKVRRALTKASTVEVPE